MATPPDARPFFSGASVAVRCASSVFTGLFLLAIVLAGLGFGMTHWSLAAGYIAFCVILFFLITGEEEIPAPAMLWVFLSDAVSIFTKVAAASGLAATLAGLYLFHATTMIMIVGLIVADGIVRLLQGRDDPSERTGSDPRDGAD